MKVQIVPMTSRMVMVSTMSPKETGSGVGALCGLARVISFSVVRVGTTANGGCRVGTNRGIRA